MDFSVLNPVQIAVSLIIAATPLLFAALGELVVEKSGVLNLGVEGMMIVGAIGGFSAAHATGSLGLAVAAGAGAGAALAFVFAFMTQYLLSNQVATGLALTLFGLGIAALLGQDYAGQTLDVTTSLYIEGVSDLPVVGPLLLSFDPLTYASLVMVALVWWFLTRTRPGLNLRAVGENHDAAHAIGYRVRRIRVLAILFGGAMAGVGGAYLAVVQTPLWVEGMTAGRGWIALAIVVFAAWRPWRALLGAYLFGGITIIQLNLQALGVAIESQYLAMTPYLVTIVVLVVISADKARARLNAPACLGKAFYASR
ncbi:MAG: ABC transporter permease [Pseudomonadota bacterium]